MDQIKKKVDFVSKLSNTGNFTDKILLNETTEINNSTVDEFLLGLRSCYKTFDGAVGNHTDKYRQVQTIILNSMYTQKRVVLAINRDSIRKAGHLDKNWKTKFGFSNDYYSQMLAYLAKQGIFKVLKAGTDDNPGVVILELVDSDFLSYFDVKDLDTQRKEALEFWTNGALDFRKKDKNNTSDEIASKNTDQLNSSLSDGVNKTISQVATSNKSNRQLAISSSSPSSLADQEQEGREKENLIKKYMDISFPENQFSDSSLGPPVNFTNKKLVSTEERFYEEIKHLVDEDLLDPPILNLVRKKSIEFSTDIRTPQNRSNRSVYEKVDRAVAPVSVYGPHTMPKKIFETIIENRFNSFKENEKMMNLKNLKVLL